MEKLLKELEGMDLSQYTKESVSNLEKAVVQAKAVMEDESLSEDDQEVVNAAVKELKSAIKNLSAVEETPSNPSKPDEGTETPSVPEKGEEGTETPSTGDNSGTAIVFATAAIMLSALAIIWKRRKEAE